MTSIPPPPGPEPPPPVIDPARTEPSGNGGAPAPAIAPPPPRGAAAWAPWLGLVALLAGFGATIVVGGVVILVAGAFGASTDDPPPAINIGLTLFQNLALIGAALFFARIGGRPRAADFGLRATALAPAVGLLVAVWIAFYVVSALWVAALGLDQPQDLPDRLGADGPLLNALTVVVLITVIAPLGEELFFRGFLFGALRNWRGPWLAAIIAGLVFGLIHAGSAPWGYLAPLAFFGVGLCLLYQWTGSLYPSIALHALNNSVALGMTMKWYWQIPVMMVGSVIATLAIARLAARVLGASADAPAASGGAAPQPRAVA